MWIFLAWKQMSFVKPPFSPSGRSEVRFRTACWAVKKTWSAICAVNHVGFFFFFFEGAFKACRWVYHSLSSFHSYCSLKFHMLSWVELRGGKHASPLRMFYSETRQSRWAKHASTTAIFARAPISRVYKKHFYAHFEEYRITDLMETAEFGKKKTFVRSLEVFFFFVFFRIRVNAQNIWRKQICRINSSHVTDRLFALSALQSLHYFTVKLWKHNWAGCYIWEKADI